MTMKGVPAGPRRRATPDRWLIEITTRDGNGFIKTNGPVPRAIGHFLRTLGLHLSDLYPAELEALKEIDRKLMERAQLRWEQRKQTKKDGAP